MFLFHTLPLLARSRFVERGGNFKTYRAGGNQLSFPKNEGQASKQAEGFRVLHGCVEGPVPGEQGGLGGSRSPSSLLVGLEGMERDGVVGGDPAVPFAASLPQRSVSSPSWGSLGVGVREVVTGRC